MENQTSGGSQKKLSDEPLISVVIPTHNRKDHLIRLLESIFESNYHQDNLEITVVDDLSSDGTGDLIKKKYSSVKIIRNQKELWSSLSRNVGAKNSKGDFIFFIDDDNVIEKNCISELVKILLANNDIGCVGPIMYFYSNKNRVAWGGSKRGRFTSLTKIFTYIPSECFIQTEYIPNAFMVRKKIAEKIGYFDGKNFPFHYDDGDFCQRIKKEGCEIVFTPKAKVWHDIALPESVKEKTRLFHCSSVNLAYHNSRSRILYQKKHTTKGQFFAFLFFFNWLVALYYFKIILFDSKKSFKEKFKIWNGYLKGISAGLELIKNKI